MKYTIILFIISILLLNSCNSQENQYSKYLTHVEVDNYKLKADGIFMENYLGESKRTELYYGEKVTFHYENLIGFNLQDSLAYPEMDIYVTDKKGDTIMSQTKLFKNMNQGYKEDELNLRNNATAADPMMPGNTYTYHVNIQDKYSDAYYNWKGDFSIQDLHPMINVDNNGMTYDVLYLYSQQRNISLVDNRVAPNESVYIIIENLEGYTVDENGNVAVKVTMKTTDATGAVIEENNDLFPNPVKAEDLKAKLFASMVVSGENINNPVTCEFSITDKQSNNSLAISFEVIIEEPQPVKYEE